MSKSSDLLVYFYAKKHWPSHLPKNLVPTSQEINEATNLALKDLEKDATKTGMLIRLAGQSGSGKTTQLLPAAESYFKAKNLKPILIATRNLVKYHPHYQEILKNYGESELRKRTDDFATILMYRVMRILTRKNYDLIIDVSFVSPKVEKLLMLMTKNYQEYLFLIMAVSRKISEQLLRNRTWRHDEKLEREFFISTERALTFYGKSYPNIRTVIWGFNQLKPIYDGKIKNALPSWKKEITTVATINEKFTIEEKISAKIAYLKK